MLKGIVDKSGENINRLRNKRDKGTELQVQGILIQDKNQFASVFNIFFIDSVQDLAQGFSVRSKDIISPNNVISRMLGSQQ